MSHSPHFSSIALSTAMLGIALAAPGTSAPAVAEPSESAFLQSFAGEWRGQGAFRRSPRHEPESVVCRANASVNGTHELQIGGRCGGEGFTGTFRITAQYDPASDTYTALFAGPPSVGSSQLAGHRENGNLQLSVNHPGQPPSTLQIAQQSQSAFRIHSRTTSGQETFTSAEIHLQRQ